MVQVVISGTTFYKQLNQINALPVLNHCAQIRVHFLFVCNKIRFFLLQKLATLFLLFVIVVVFFFGCLQELKIFICFLDILFVSICGCGVCTFFVYLHILLLIP